MERVLAALEACVLDTFLPQALPRACPPAAAATALADALAAATDAPQAAMLGRMQVLYEQNTRSESRERSQEIFCSRPRFLWNGVFFFSSFSFRRKKRKRKKAGNGHKNKGLSGKAPSVTLVC